MKRDAPASDAETAEPSSGDVPDNNVKRRRSDEAPTSDTATEAAAAAPSDEAKKDVAGSGPASGLGWTASTASPWASAASKPPSWGSSAAFASFSSAPGAASGFGALSTGSSSSASASEDGANKDGGDCSSTVGRSTLLPALAKNGVMKTGEEDEQCSFQVRAKLYRLQAGEGGRLAWKEVGSGALKINLPRPSATTSTGGTVDTKDATADSAANGEGSAPANRQQRYPRLVMRREGVLNVLLNATVWPKMPLERAGDKTLRFSCDSVAPSDDTRETSSTSAASKGEGGGGLASFLLRLPRIDECDELFAAITKAKAFKNE